MKHLKEFTLTLVPKLDFRTAVIKPHIIPFLCVVALMMAFYLASRFIQPGWLTYVLSSACLSLVGITALARVNDITHKQTGRRWQVRRAGLILVGAACLGLIVAPSIDGGLGAFVDFPTWREVMFRLGVTLTWITTPMMPPWHRYITGEYKRVKIEVPLDVEVDVVRTETTSDGSMYESKK